MGTVHTLLRFEKDPKDTIKSWFEESKTTKAQLCHGLGADRRSLLSKFYITIDREERLKRKTTATKSILLKSVNVDNLPKGQRRL